MKGTNSKVGSGETSFLALGERPCISQVPLSWLTGKARTSGHQVGGSLPPSVFLGPVFPMVQLLQDRMPRQPVRLMHFHLILSCKPAALTASFTLPSQVALPQPHAPQPQSPHFPGP